MAMLEHFRAISTVSRLALGGMFLCSVGYAAIAAPLAPESLTSWRLVGDAQVSRDGSKVAFVVQTPKPDRKGYVGDIWLWTGSEARAVTSDPADDRLPRWSPDGSKLAFVSARSGKRQVYIIEGAGEPWQATDSATDVQSFAWSPDGRQLGIIATDAAAPGDPPVVMISERLIYRSDGSPGFRPSDRFSQIWVADLPSDRKAAKPRQLTRDAFAHANIEWSPSGDRILYSANTSEPDDFEAADSEIYSIDAKGGGAPASRITSRKGNDDLPKASPDGKWLAYIGADAGTPTRAFSDSNLYFRATGSQTATKVAGSDGAGGISSTDSNPVGHAANRIAWSPDGRYAYFTLAREGRVHLYRAKPGGSAERVSTCLDGIVRDFTVSKRGVALTYASATEPADIFFLEDRCRSQRISSIGRENIATADMGSITERRIKSFDGRSIQYWTLTPKGFDRSRKYPALLYIHGGPNDMYGVDFFHEFQVLASAGYVVIFGNPRGSSGYGQEFGNIIQGNYPGDDAKDLLATVDDAIAQGGVDPNRIGVAGGSGGGVLSSWLIGQTPRFKAAIVERSITDWSSFAGTSDVAAYFSTRYFPALSWRAREAYWAKSSLSLVDKVQTPVLVIHNEQDYRTPLEQGLQYYTALKLQKKPAKLAVFPVSGHSMYREGSPEQKIVRMNIILDWLGQHLGKSAQ